MVCVKCNKALPDDSMFCPGCGSYITRATEIGEIQTTKSMFFEQPVKSTKKACLIELGVIIGAIIVIVIVIALLSSRQFNLGKSSEEFSVYTVSSDGINVFNDTRTVSTIQENYDFFQTI